MAIPNPLARWGQREGIGVPEMARRLGLSRSYVWMLTNDQKTSLTRKTMRRIEEATNGGVTVAALTRWVDAHAERAA